MNDDHANLEHAPLLLGSTFPLNLVRRRVSIEPAGLAELRQELAGRPVASFWGHTTTLAAASAILGADVTPKAARPALMLDPEGLPSLDGIVFDECWVLSPEYVPGYRPAIGEEVPLGKITGWQVLKIGWCVRATGSACQPVLPHGSPTGRRSP